MIQRMFVTLDTKKTNYKNVGKINHGDDLILEITVLSDGDMISFNDPMVDLLVKKSDGKMIRQNSGIEHIQPNKFIIEVKKDCVTSPGLTTNQLVINDNGRISTCMFYYTILNSLEEDIIQSISSVEVLEQLDEYVIEAQERMELLNNDINELEELFGATSDKLVEAENARNEAEQKRAQSEILRVNNENNRIEADNIRNQNEVDRSSSELVREQRESERILNEEERHQNESERMIDESTRQQNENARQSNESIRMSNEIDRKTQENRRVTAETNRVNAETTRRNNENIRISNESERQKTMNEMKSLLEDARGFNDRVGVVEDEIEEINSSLDNKASKVDLIIQSNRIDSFVSELIDGRIGADGLTYKNVGTANRKQFEKIINLVNTIEEYQNAFIPILSESGYIDVNGTLQTSDKWITYTLPLEYGEVYSYKGISHIGSTVYYAIYTADDTFITSYKCNKTEDSDLTFDKNASKLKISIYKTEASDFYFLKKQKNKVKSIGIIDNTNISNYSDYIDFDNVKPNTIITYNINDNSIFNAPTQGITKGTLLTFSGRDVIKGGITQFFITSSNDFYFRILYGTTTYKNWKKIITDNDIGNKLDEKYNFISLFEEIGVIGDSWASGFTYPNGVGTNNYSISWPQILGRKNGIKVTNFTKGGLSCKTWLSDKMGLNLLNTETPKNLYINALGINDATIIDNGTIELGNINDIDKNNPSNNATTFYGYYGKIISSILSKNPNAKIILITIPRTDKPTYSLINNAIIEIATLFGVCYVNSLDSSLFTSDMFINSKVNAHPTAVGYSAMADVYEDLISRCITDNYEYFINYYGYNN